MRIYTGFKRAWLRRQFNICQDAADPAADPPVAATPLIDQLNAQLATRVDAIQTGQTIVQSAGNGQSVTFSTSSTVSSGGPGAGVMPNMVDEMITRYERAKADLGGDPSDEEIFNKMMASLVAIRQSTNSFAGLRFAAAGPRS